MLIAVTREVSDALERCELTHLDRAPIHVDRARAEHREYERSLEELGCQLQRLPPARDLPDSVFVEDAAVVTDELAVITRPGAASRRAETTAVAELLARYRAVRRIEAPGTLDGGDVLCVGHRMFVGRSSRTNAAGIEQLRAVFGALGYSVQEVPVRGCLHLKTAVTAVANDLLLINRECVPASALAGFELVDVHPAEPLAANALRIGEALVYPAEFPRTRKRLEACGVQVRTVPAGELAKAEGGVTCCSIIFAA